MTRPVRTLAALPRDLGSIPSTQMIAHVLSVHPVTGDSVTPGMHMVHRHKYRHSHKIKLKLKKYSVNEKNPIFSFITYTVHDLNQSLVKI